MFYASGIVNFVRVGLTPVLACISYQYSIVLL